MAATRLHLGSNLLEQAFPGESFDGGRYFKWFLGLI